MSAKILSLTTLGFLGIIIFTNYSLTGFWTDWIISILLICSSIIAIYKLKFNEKASHSLAVFSSILFAVLLVFGFGILYFWNHDILKTRSFYFQKVEGRLFNAYFRPVGAYSGGEGDFWISESPALFPIIEVEKYYKHAILWDFRETEWENQPVDQFEIVKRYIEEEVIEKERK